VALIHAGASLTPTKRELIAAWLPGRPWAAGLDVTGFRPVGAFRFDDPAGEVGIETALTRTADGTVLQLPFSYRDAPLAGADEWLVGTTEHSVLGPRWVYDGCADPVAVRALVGAILTGGHEAEQVLPDGTVREATTRVAGSGSAGTPVPAFVTVTAEDTATATVVQAADLVLTVRRRLAGPAPAGATLTGTWPDGPPTVLAVLAGRG
jgi:hypothetical protein